MTTAAANERLKQRFDQWDHNGDGTLQRSDFEQEASQIVRTFGVSESSPEARALHDAMVNLYEYHAQEAGVGTDGAIDESQFMRVNENLIFEQGEAAFNRVLSPLIKAIIGLCDKNADGRINNDEFRAWLRGIGVPESQAEDAFRQIDTTGDGELSEKELLAAVRNFHFGKLDVPLLG